MSTSTSSRVSLAAVALALMCSACTEHAAARFATAGSLPQGKRKPDGVAVDLTSEPPDWQKLGHTDDDIMTLRTPLSTTAALKAIRNYFDSAVREDINAIQKAVKPGTRVSDTSSGTRRRVHNLHYMWRQRFFKHEYQQLSSRLIYRESEIRTYRPGTSAALPAHLKAMRRFAAGSDPLVMRVPITAPTVKNQRLFGDEVVFWFHRDGNKYVITHIAEDIPF